MNVVITIGGEWRPLIPGQPIHVGNPAHVMPEHTKLVHTALDGATALWAIVDNNDVTLEMLVDAGARHLLIQGIDAEVSIGFGEAAVVDESIVADIKQPYVIGNLGLLAKHLYLACTGTVVVQAWR